MTEQLLVVDDEQGSCSELADELETLGYHVTCVHSGAHALNLMNQHHFDLLLLDMSMRGTDTGQFIRRLRSNERMSSVPIVVVVTENETEKLHQCMEQGADDWLIEPYTPPLLHARIGHVLEHHRRRLEEQEDCAKAQKLADELQQVILPVGIALSAETDFDRLLEQILIEAKIAANTDAGTLYLRDDDKLEWAIVLTDSLGVALGGTTGNKITFPPLPLYGADGNPNMKNVASYVALTGQSVKVADVYNAQDFDFAATKKFDEQNGYRTKSVLTVPLKNNKEEVIGVLQLINSQDPVTGEVDAFDFYEQLVIETLASQAAVALNNQLVFKRQSELLKLERDVQVGHSIQADFLPKDEDLPHRKGWEIATCLHPARQVAGDFYDVFEMTSDRIGFLVADVCDKGVGAALFMALMRSLLRAFAQQHYTSDLTGLLDEGRELHRGDEADDLQTLPSAGSLALEKAVQMTNDYVAINHGMLGMFATMFFGVLNPTNGTVLYINGGHNAPLLVDASGKIKQQITQTGPAVGMFPNAHFEIHKTRLMPGDCLVVYTDGVPDARAPGGAFFTEHRLLELAQTPTTSARDLLETIESAVFKHISTADQFDDVTLMIVRRSLPDEKKK
jgi:sigma-B regulation protein RsbU (phosphoserine phosphatase)